MRMRTQKHDTYMRSNRALTVHAHPALFQLNFPISLPPLHAACSLPSLVYVSNPQDVHCPARRPRVISTSG